MGRGSERLGFVLITHGYGEHCGRCVDSYLDFAKEKKHDSDFISQF